MPIQVGIGLSTKKDPIQAAEEATRLAKTNINTTRISLGIVFSSIDLACASLLKAISISLEDIPIIGCSGAAIISSQGIFKHGLAVMLLSLPESVYFNTACVQGIKTKTSLSAGKELAEKLLYGFRDVRRDLSIIFSDGLIQEGSSLIYGLQKSLGTSFPLVGASASDDLRFLKTYLYFNQELFSDAACGILWGGRLGFGLGVKHGWKPLGKPRYVTKSMGNVVYEIDNAPAAKIYEDYLAYNLAKLRKELRHISIFYPIGIYLPGEEEYLLRNILSIEDDGSLVFQGDIPQESLVRLMIGTKESCLQATQQAVEEAQKGLSASLIGLKKSQMKSFVIVFDSVSRYILLRRGADRELQIIKKSLGEDTPILGIYTYGEQAPLRAISYQGRAYFHNQTITILTMAG